MKKAKSIYMGSGVNLNIKKAQKLKEKVDKEIAKSQNKTEEEIEYETSLKRKKFKYIKEIHSVGMEYLEKSYHLKDGSHYSYIGPINDDIRYYLAMLQTKKDKP